MIDLRNVKKFYPNGTVALDGVDLHVEDGEFVFIVGSSGAGKTTLSKLLLCEERITGDFLKTVLLRALPGGVAATFCAALSMAMKPVFGWPGDLCSTLATLSAGAVCWMVLCRACLPMNRIRRLLLIAVAAAFVLAYLLLGRHFFFLVPLTGPAVGVLAGLAVFGCGMIFLCDFLIKRRAGRA